MSIATGYSRGRHNSTNWTCLLVIASISRAVLSSSVLGTSPHPQPGQSGKGVWYSPAQIGHNINIAVESILFSEEISPRQGCGISNIAHSFSHSETPLSYA